MLPAIAAILAGLAAPPAGAADTKPLAVTTVVLSRSNCQFSTNAAATLDFGTLNPAGGANAVTSASINARCIGSANSATFLVTRNGGLHGAAGQNQMRHASVTTEFLPYTLAISPSSGTVLKNQVFAVSVTGTILGSNYRSARVGSYSDTVVLTINP
ncbi:MAG TPA: spore coat protein U domain-containing protein [Burkholderiales bacterium]|nr:spore coat protein U domain-containing protein [Burkholderiales bacterium]